MAVFLFNNHAILSVMKFVIFGTGGVGGYFGGKLARNQTDVWFLARGKHLEAMNASGLHINSTEGDWVIPPGKMTDDPHKIGRAHVVLFCVKSYDTEVASHQLQPLLDNNTMIISLQNGIDNEEKIKRIIPAGIVYGGVANIYSTVSAPGVISEAGGPKKLIFGPIYAEDAATAERARGVLRELLNANINAEYTHDIRTALWKKFIFITAVGGLTALTRLTLGEILELKETRDLLQKAMRETQSVALALGIPIEPSFVDSLFEILKKFDNNTRSSLHYDLTHGKPLEIEALSGTVVRYGTRLGISIPIQNTIYSSLLPYHLKHTRLSQQEKNRATA